MARLREEHFAAAPAAPVVAKRWLSFQELCAYLDCGRTVAKEFIRDNHLHAAPRILGRRNLLFDRLEIDAIIESRLVRPRDLRLVANGSGGGR
jgi:predicted DNA-binding transcriptional regulator AlpA